MTDLMSDNTQSDIQLVIGSKLLPSYVCYQSLARGHALGLGEVMPRCNGRQALGVCMAAKEKRKFLHGNRGGGGVTAGVPWVSRSFRCSAGKETPQGIHGKIPVIFSKISLFCPHQFLSVWRGTCTWPAGDCN